MSRTSAAPPTRYREVLVAPKAARREALFLVLAIGLIIACMGLRFYILRSGEEAIREKPACQLSDIYLQNQAPVLYRSLLGVAADIVDLRLEDGSWPDVARLKDDALPPFAANFLPTGLRGYIWKAYAREGWVDYFGINGDLQAGEPKEGSDPLENSFILRIIDLQSDSHPHPHAGNHEEGDKRFVIQVWMNTRPVDYPGEELVKHDWKWIVGADRSGL
jgi:hypothetical protein